MKVMHLKAVKIQRSLEKVGEFAWPAAKSEVKCSTFSHAPDLVLD